MDLFLVNLILINILLLVIAVGIWKLKVNSDEVLEYYWKNLPTTTVNVMKCLEQLQKLDLEIRNGIHKWEWENKMRDFETEQKELKYLDEE